MVKYLRKGRILTSQLVEPGVLKPWRTNILYWCGASAKDFNEEKFLRFVKKHKKDKLLKYGFFIPLVIYKKDFIEIGGWPTEDDTQRRIPNDRLFIRKALERGYEFYRVGESFSYHFQASSWKKGRRKPNLLRRLIWRIERMSIEREVSEKLY